MHAFEIIGDQNHIIRYITKLRTMVQGRLGFAFEFI